MTVYQSIEGSNVTESADVSVTFWNNTRYNQVLTKTTSIPASVPVDLDDSSRTKTWKSPKSDKSSFKKIKESGLIKMSNYDVGTHVITNSVIRIPRQSWYFFKGGNYTLTSNNLDFFDRNLHLWDLTADYHMVMDLPRARLLFPASPYYSVGDPSTAAELDDLVEGAKEDVVSKLNSSYDPLTELAELRETLETLHSLVRAAISPIRSYREWLASNHRSGKSVSRETASKWLEYRYAIMPLVYSIHDVVETYKRNKLVYHTERSVRNFQKSITSASGTGSQFYETLTQSSRITAVGKRKPSENSTLRLIDDLSINPFKTAWEIIPFSFVVDWFVNVGSFIEAQTGALMNFSSQRGFCYAIKTNYVRDTYFRDYYDSRRILKTGPWFVNPPKKEVFGEVSRAAGQVYNTDYLLRSEKFSSYSRRVFLPSDIGLRSDIFLNWKRWVDAFCLTLGKTKRSLRT